MSKGGAAECSRPLAPLTRQASGKSPSRTDPSAHFDTLILQRFVCFSFFTAGTLTRSGTYRQGSGRTAARCWSPADTPIWVHHARTEERGVDIVQFA